MLLKTKIIKRLIRQLTLSGKSYNPLIEYCSVSTCKEKEKKYLSIK